jgi:hypothetical protein
MTPISLGVMALFGLGIPVLEATVICQTTGFSVVRHLIKTDILLLFFDLTRGATPKKFTSLFVKQYMGLVQ